MEETVILDLQQMKLFLLLRVRDITETTMQEAGLDEVQSQSEHEDSEESSSSDSRKEDSVATTSKGRLMCAQETVRSPRLEPKNGFHVVTENLRCTPITQHTVWRETDKLASDLRGKWS